MGRAVCQRPRRIDKNHSTMLDTALNVDTPEGAHLRLVVAGPLPRLLAFGVDLAVKFGLFLVTSLVAETMLGDITQGVMLIITFLLLWAYPILFELLWGGRTPGKSALGLKVINRDGTPVDWGSSVIRNLLRVVDFLPLCYVAGLISMLFSQRFERLGDLAGGTLVVYDQLAQRVESVGSAVPVAVPVRLDLVEQRALIRFAQRRRDLSESRRDELAAIAAPVLKVGAETNKAADHLDGMAAWLMGRRPGDKAK